MREKALADRIIAYLKAHKRLTVMEAVELFHTTRLSARIFDLRERGYLIDTLMVRDIDPLTKAEYKYGVYVYKGETKKTDVLQGQNEK